MLHTTTAATGISVLACHPDSLLADAIAAAMRRHLGAHRAVGVSSLTMALAAFDTAVDVAIVFDDCDEDIVDLFEAMRHRGMRTPVVVATGPADLVRAAQLLESGAAGILPAEAGIDEWCDAVRGAWRGDIVVHGPMRDGVLDALRARRRDRRLARQQLSQLSASNETILRLLCDGVTVARIAERLCLSPYTVRGHVRDIGRAIGARGQLSIAATGRRLLATARLPGGDDDRAADSRPEKARSPAGRGPRLVSTV